MKDRYIEGHYLLVSMREESDGKRISTTVNNHIISAGLFSKGGLCIVSANKGECRMKRICVVFLMGCLAGASFGEGEQLVLSASKDNFGRSNKRNRNNGASETLAIAHAPNIRTIMAFDLSSVTNEIVGAELRFRQHNDMQQKTTLIVAAMVNTTNNVAWGEGSGNLGVGGQNSKPGESCYAYSAFREVPWESATAEPLSGLSDSRLWSAPVAALDGLAWKEGGWVRIPIQDVALLEEIRKSKSPAITLGLWGKAGDGLYFISSKNSQWVPELHLTLKVDEK